MDEATQVKADRALATRVAMQGNGEKSLREHLVDLVQRQWNDPDYNGKRPFGHSGWPFCVYSALIRGGLIPGEVGEAPDYFVEWVDEEAGGLLMQACFQRMRMPAAVLPETPTLNNRLLLGLEDRASAQSRRELFQALWQLAGAWLLEWRRDNDGVFAGTVVPVVTHVAIRAVARPGVQGWQYVVEICNRNDVPTPIKAVTAVLQAMQAKAASDILTRGVPIQVMWKED